MKSKEHFHLYDLLKAHCKKFSFKTFLYYPNCFQQCNGNNDEKVHFPTLSIDSKDFPIIVPIIPLSNN